MFDVAIWGTVGQWTAAIATLCAVSVALFKDDFLRARRRPQLHVAVSLAPPNCHKTVLNPIEEQRTALTTIAVPCYYLRIWVENRGMTRAESVQAFVAQVKQKQDDGSFKELSRFLPMNLRWSHGRPDGSPEIYAGGIAPGMGKHCDLVRIADPAGAEDAGDKLEGIDKGLTVGAVQLEMFPNNGAHVLGPGTYQIVLRLAAANARPVDTTLELFIAGDWFDEEDEMFAKGVGLKAV